MKAQEVVSNSVSAGEHVTFLDGLRGIAALYVVLYHAIAIQYTNLSAHDKFLCTPLMFGYVAVTVFIVLSGWCLMMPVANAADLQLRGGIRGFIFRRAKRILPPYYAAVLISCLLPALASRLVSGAWPEKWFNSWCTYLGKHDLLAHLTLVHNLWPQYARSISPPLWSVATEWQIYFLFALILLPILRRFGILAALTLAALVGIGPLYLLPNAQDFYSACPWLILLFAIGMAGAMITYSQNERIKAQAASLPLRIGLLWLGLTLFSLITAHPFQRRVWAIWNLDIIVGLLTVWMIVAVTRDRREARLSLVRRVLESQVAVSLGRFSYSLYLMHYTLILALLPFVYRYHLSPRRLVCLNLLAGVPLALVGSYLFYRLFEKPFLNARGTYGFSIRPLTSRASRRAGNVAR